MKKKFFVCLVSCIFACNYLSACAADNNGNTEAGLKVYYAFDETSGNKAKEGVSDVSQTVNYVFAEANQKLLYKPASEAQWRSGGVRNGALLFDGYSTYIEDKNFKDSSIREQFTINVWVAPRAYENTSDGKLTAIVGKGDKSFEEGFILGYGDLGKWGLQLALENEYGGVEVAEFYDTNQLLPLCEWSMLTASFNTKYGRITLYLNGVAVYENIIENYAGTSVVSSGDSLLIGKYIDPSNAWGFDCNMFCGLMDELKIYSRELEKDEVKAMYDKYTEDGHPAVAWEDIRIDESVYLGDRYRPQYHLIPPGAWMNEPHGPLYYKGKFHIFYQHNSTGPYWAQLRWGHLVSDDMIHWKYLPDAVVPTAGIAPVGVWSGGSCVGPDGVPVLVVTAGNDNTTYSNQNIAYARPKDPTDPYLTEWVLDDTLALTQQPGWGKQGEFRDPFVWEDDGVYYMLIASSRGADSQGYLGGAALLYTSEDLTTWRFEGNIFSPSYKKYPEIGVNWELPILLPVNNGEDGENKIQKYIFVIIPQYKDGTPVEAYYWLGAFNKETMRFTPDADHPEPRLLNFGTGYFTGPAGLCYRTEEEREAGAAYEDGRTILFSLSPNSDPEYNQVYYSGWTHNGGMPLELYISKDGGELRFKTVTELASVRNGEALVNISEETSLEEAQRQISSVRGDTLEIDLKIKVNSVETNADFGIDLRYNPFGGTKGEQEYTRFVYRQGNDVQNGFTVDRYYSSHTTASKVANHLYGYSVAAGEVFDIKILLDRSMLEIYINNTFAFTTRIYPTYSDSDYLRLFADGCEMNVENLTIYKMNSAYSSINAPAYYDNAPSLKE